MMSRQSCSDVALLLDRRTETLAESERLLLESHLGTCDACRREAAALIGMRELALAAVPQQARSSTRDRVMERVLASAPPSIRMMAPRRPAPWLWVGGGLAVAAAAAAMLALVLRRPEETDLRAATETARPLATVTLEHGEVFAGYTRLASGAAAPAETLLAAPSGATLRVTHARVALDAGAQVAWLESSQTLHLATGRATIEGDPTAHRSWRVETARFRIEVLGTRFAVEPERVVVAAGRVRILDLKGEVLVDALGAGGVWTFGREEAAAATRDKVEAPLPAIARDAPETAPVFGPLQSRDPAVPVEAGAVLELAAAPLELDDGSRVLLEPGARLQVLTNDGAQFVTVLDRGAARFELSPGGSRRWIVETPVATVEVVGAAFRIERSPGRLVVDVQRGIVLVRGDRVPGRLVRLTDGQRIEVDAVAPVVSAPPAPRPPAPAAPSAGPRPRPRSPARPAAATKQAPPTLDDALREADRLRAAGDARAAADLLERALASAPRDAVAGLAWFTLGRIRADQLDQPERAAHAFAQVIALGQPPSLIEDAHQRRVEALLHAGRRGEAATALGAFERAFPSSERAAALRVRLAP